MAKCYYIFCLVWALVISSSTHVRGGKPISFHLSACHAKTQRDINRNFSQTLSYTYHGGLDLLVHTYHLLVFQRFNPQVRA